MKSKRIENQEVLDLFRNKPCAACGKIGSDPCHIKSRGSGGPDAEWNLISLCREHHTEQHAIGWYRMVWRYPLIAFKLAQKGWCFTRDSKIRNDRLNKE